MDEPHVLIRRVQELLNTCLADHVSMDEPHVLIRRAQELLDTCLADHVPMYKPYALIREPNVEARTGLRRSTLYELIGRSLFPRPVKIAGTRSVAWVESEVDAWIKAQIEAARGIANP